MQIQTLNHTAGATIIMSPVMDAKPDVLYVNGLLATIMTGRAQAHMFQTCDSNIAHARNTIANLFRLKLTGFDRLVMIDADIGWSLQDWDYLMEGSEPVVIAEYARKVSYEPGKCPAVSFGAGFCRIDRTVFETLDAWLKEDGSERIPTYFEDGQLYRDYFYTGAAGDGRYLPEDRGFWSYLRLAEIPLRVETRTRLNHVGRAVFPYTPSDLPAGGASGPE